MTWYVMPSGGTGVYTYSWSGTDALAGTGPSVLKKYSTLGAKTASVKVISGSASVTANCTTTVVSGTAAVSVGVKATTATTVAVSATGPTCGEENETPACLVILVNGILPHTKFSDAIQKLPIVNSKKINFFVVPFSGTAAVTGISISTKIKTAEPFSKILVAAHSFGATAAFNHGYKGPPYAKYLYYDPYYDGAPVGLCSSVAVRSLEHIFSSVTLNQVVEIINGIQNGLNLSLPGVVNWTDGFKKNWTCINVWPLNLTPEEVAFNDRQSKLHQSFDPASYPEDTLEVAKKKAIASMSATTAWIDQNCPNKDVDVTTN